MAAAIVATKFTHDLLKLILLGQNMPCAVWLGYDSLTVGMQLQGTWQSQARPLDISLLRSLHRLVQVRFGSQISAWHVPSHRGEPGNELVDALAYAAAMEGGTHDLDHFLTHTAQARFVQDMEWVWMLFDRSYKAMWHANNLHFPMQPSTTPDAHVFPSQTHVHAHHSSEAHCKTSQMTLKIGSCNVLTLKSADCKAWGIEGVARQESLLEQYHSSAYNIIAFQETRLRKLYRAQDERFVLVKSAANASGSYGLLLGLSKKVPHGWLPSSQESTDKLGVPVYFSESHVSVILADPRRLIVRVRSPVLKCIIIVAHAPHTGHSDEEVHTWWQMLGTLIPPKYHEWPRLLLCDANARLGSVATLQVGDFQAENENSKSEAFRTFLSEQGIWLPSTFEQFQKGDGGTWLHPTGKWIRGDFIGMPVQWRFTDCQAFVDDEIDVSTLKEDHRTVAVAFECPGRCSTWTPDTRCARLTDEHVLAIRPDDFTKIDGPDFHTDVHTHAWQLEQQILAQLRPSVCRPRKQPRKTSMTPETWKLIGEKKMWRTHLWKSKQLQQRTILQVCFQSLKEHRSWDGHVSSWDQLTSLLQQQDRLIAQAMQQHRQICRRVVSALRRDDAIFLVVLLRKLANLCIPIKPRISGDESDALFLSSAKDACKRLRSNWKTLKISGIRTSNALKLAIPHQLQSCCKSVMPPRLLTVVCCKFVICMNCQPYSKSKMFSAKRRKGSRQDLTQSRLGFSMLSRSKQQEFSSI